MARLCAYYKARQGISGWQYYVSVPKALVPASLPWRASRPILSAIQAPIPSSQESSPWSLNDFGAFLVNHAHALSSECAVDLHELKDSGKLRRVKDERLTDSCADTPIDLPASIPRLITLLDNAATSPRSLSRSAIALAIVGAVIVALLFGSWSSLGLRDDLQGVRSVLPAMFSTLVASAAICAGMRDQLTNALDLYGLAKSKTFNKCCAALLAVATLLLGIGLSSGNTSPTPVYVGLALYAATVMTTISAEHMVNTGEARLKELSEVVGEGAHTLANKERAVEE